MHPELNPSTVGKLPDKDSNSTYAGKKKSPGIFLAIKAIEKGLERGSISKAVTSDVWCIASVKTFVIREVGNKVYYLPLSVRVCMCVYVRMCVLVYSGTGSQKNMLISWNCSHRLCGNLMWIQEAGLRFSSRVAGVNSWPISLQHQECHL